MTVTAWCLNARVWPNLFSAELMFALNNLLAFLGVWDRSAHVVIATAARHCADVSM